MFGLAVGESACVYKIWNISSLFIGLLSKVIMMIRTWAAWNKNRTLTYALPIFFIFISGGSIAIVGIFLRTLQSQHSVLKTIDLQLYYLLHILYYSFQPVPVLLPRMLGATWRAVIPLFLSLGFSFSSMTQVCLWSIAQCKPEWAETLFTSYVDIDGYSSLGSLWACFKRWFECIISQR